MIRYNYNAQLNPPAPFVLIVLRNPVDGRELRDVPAQLDVGADRTVLPDSIVGALGLAQIGNIWIAGLGGATHSLPVFVVELGVHDLPVTPVKVISSDEPWVLLGRDVLNVHRLLLDGPQLVLEIG
jgi:hypothetical protein